MKDVNSVLALSVKEWAELTRGGAAIPVKTRLDGVSMQPLIRRGRDAVTIMAIDRPILRGDIVLFQRGDGAYVVHRVRRVAGERLTTLGDNCWNEDSPIRASDVLGIAVSVQRGACSLRLDSRLSRALGRVWMAAHGPRIGYRRVRGAIIRRVKGLFQWMKRD